jgi:benzoate membrane transport protein
MTIREAESETFSIKSGTLQRNLPSIGAAVRAIIIFITVLSIPLTAAKVLHLSQVETSSWILALYGLPAILSLFLTVIYRQPLLLTGNIFFIIFINGLEGQLSYSELIGASIVAGIVVMLVVILGLTELLATWIPVPIMYGMLAGAVMPFVSNIFTTLGDETAVVGGTLLAYLISRRVLGTRMPAILLALVTGLAVSAVTGSFEQIPETLLLTVPELTLPVFSLPAIITATPVFFVLITLQSNLPSVRFLQSQKYHPPEVVIGVVSAIGTILGSLLGPTGVSLSLPASSLVAGPEAGEHKLRHRSVYLVSMAALLVGLLASIAVEIAAMIPLVLMLTLAGLSVVNVLNSAIQRITRGPLLLGPLFAFAVAVSEISFLGFGPFFWSLVIGTGISLLLERDELIRLRKTEQ